jgi:hypothetical protein
LFFCSCCSPQDPRLNITTRRATANTPPGPVRRRTIAATTWIAEAFGDNEWRETSEGTEVKISGRWCLVLPEHRIIRGKSPDWSKAHACVQPDVKYSTGRKTPCERLLCFSGVPKS